MKITAYPSHAQPLILCVEDEADLREDLVDELQEAGYTVLAAQDAYQALEYLKTIHPSLILCDITMPGMDGYELLDIVRAQYPSLVDTPFVFLTAQATPQQVIQGKRAGADDYLVKPLDFDLMLATIATRIEQVNRIHKRFASDTYQMQQALLDFHTRQTQASLQHVAQAFDYVAAGIVLLDADTKVQFTNRMARQLLGDTNTLALGQRFPCGSGRTAGDFRLAFDNAVLASLSKDDVVECVALSGPNGGNDLLLMLCSLASRHALADNDPVVMVMVCDPKQRKLLPPEALAGIFRLTPTEAQIACAFAEGKRSEQIAGQFGISATTVAFHKRNLFQKTNTNRQADLIALLLTLSVFSA